MGTSLLCWLWVTQRNALSTPPLVHNIGIVPDCCDADSLDLRRDKESVKGSETFLSASVRVGSRGVIVAILLSEIELELDLAISILLFPTVELDLATSTLAFATVELDFATSTLLPATTPTDLTGWIEVARQSEHWRHGIWVTEVIEVYV